jgi:RNA polymerase sigma-70 factor (ECF subfamily)
MAGFSDIVVDEGTVAAARSGDALALGRVYEQCSAATYGLIRRLVRREAVAEDLLQETFADVIEHIGSFEGRAPLPMWIRSIAVRRSLMYLRSPWHRSLEWLELRPDSEPVVPGESGRVDHCADLGQMLDSLPGLARAVVWLHDVEGYTHQEIAAQLGRSVSFSKSQLSRAHARLRRAFGPDARDPSAGLEEATACTPISTN